MWKRKQWALRTDTSQQICKFCCAKVRQGQGEEQSSKSRRISMITRKDIFHFSDKKNLNMDSLQWTQFISILMHLSSTKIWHQRVECKSCQIATDREPARQRQSFESSHCRPSLPFYVGTRIMMNIGQFKFLISSHLEHTDSHTDKRTP